MTPIICTHCDSGLPVDHRDGFALHCADCAPDTAVKLDGHVQELDVVAVLPPGRGLPGIPGQRGRRREDL